MAKSADAFRTISEVAEWLGIPTHVLRFWESKFIQIKPVKRAGGRRYYRPSDMLLLGGIKKLLHDDGMTIKGVQKILRKDGIGPVAEHSQPLDEVTATEFNEITDEVTTNVTKLSSTPVFEFKSASRQLPEASQTSEKPAIAPTAEATKAVEPASPATLAEPPLPPSPTEEVAATEPQPTKDEPVARALEAPVAAPLSPEPSPPPLQSEPAPAPAQISVPADPDDSIAGVPGLLSQLAKLPRPLPPELASKLAPVIAQLHKISGTGRAASEN